MQNYEEKKIFLNTYKNLSRFYGEKKMFNLSCKNITFTPIFVLDKMFGHLIIFTLLFLRTYGYVMSTLLLLHFPKYIFVFNVHYHLV